MNYNQAIEYLYSFIDYEKIKGISYITAGYSLRHIEELLYQLSNPHLSARTVHVAGSKGKGSTAAMIAQALTASGYRTGLYISPHLHIVRERIRIDGSFISEPDLACLTAELKPYFESARATSANHERQHVKIKQPLTFFEVLTVLAFAYFNKKKADFQVLEVGLGGRFDATNVANPEVCVITPISLEHTEVLGDSLDKIAGEKAAIIKPGTSVVSSPQPDEASRVIRDACQQQGASLVQVGKDITWYRTGGDLRQQSLVVQGKMSDYQLTIPLLGNYQLENAATAVATLEVLASSGFNISAGDIARGLSQVEWPGRFQILNRHPLVLVDGAHNVASIKRLVESIKAYFKYDQLFLVIGMSGDKDISGIVKELVPLSPHITVTRSLHARSAQPSILAAEFAKQGSSPEITDTVTEALSSVLSTARENDLVCVTGSLFVVAEALDYAARELNPQD